VKEQRNRNEGKTLSFVPSIVKDGVVEALSKVARSGNKPLYTDNFIDFIDKTLYARILIERPKFYNDYLMYGNDNKECWYKSKVEFRHRKIANAPVLKRKQNHRKIRTFRQ
ncbi:hypothetical protein HAX54_050590, partial [Datura stramonium]|nr:hypothetical protein [Datura stramonium]